MTNSRIYRWAYHILGPAVLLYLLNQTDFRQILATVHQADAGRLFVSVILMWLIIGLRAYRWHLINRSQDIRLQFWEEHNLYAAAFALGAATPGKVGEFTKVHYLHSKGHPSSRAFAGVFIDRFADLLWIILIGLPGLLYYVVGAGLPLSFRQVGLALFFLISACVAGLVLIKTIRHRLFRRILLSAFSLVQIDSLKRWVKQVWASMAHLALRPILMVFTLTLASWLVQYYQNLLFAQALGLKLGFIDIMFLASVVGLVTLLPISVGGIGSRDLSMIYLFRTLGYNQAEAISFSMCQLLALLVYAFWGGAILILRVRRKASMAGSSSKELTTCP